MRLQTIVALGALETTLLITGLVVIGGLVLGLVLARAVRNLIRQFRHSVPGVLLEQLQQDVTSGEWQRRTQEPVSLSAMDRIYGPRIEADFPGLNLDELKRRAESLAVSTLAAISEDQVTGLCESSDLYAGQLRQYLEALHSQGQQEIFRGITVHRIVLADYRKQQSTCRLGFQLAIGAQYQKTDKQGQVIAGHSGLSQFRFSIEALYVQDALQVPELMALAYNCPNCGAPVPSLGEPRCAYCGSALEPLSRKVWSFCSFKIA